MYDYFLIYFIIKTSLHYLRAQKLPIDRLSLKTSWKPLENSSLILKGILIEGGILEDTLKPCCKNSDNITPAPNCYLQWILEVGVVTSNFLLNKSLNLHFLVSNWIRTNQTWMILSTYHSMPHLTEAG